MQDIKDVQDKFQRTDKSANFVIDRITLKVQPNNYTKQEMIFGWQLRNAENKPVEGVSILGQTDVMDIESNNQTLELTILFRCLL